MGIRGGLGATPRNEIFRFRHSCACENPAINTTAEVRLEVKKCIPFGMLSTVRDVCSKLRQDGFQPAPRLRSGLKRWKDKKPN